MTGPKSEWPRSRLLEVLELKAWKSGVAIGDNLESA
jgi:hypothetical protein